MQVWVAKGPTTVILEGMNSMEVNALNPHLHYVESSIIISLGLPPLTADAGTVKLVYMYRVGSHPSPIHIGRYTVREGTALQCLRSS